VSKNFTNKQKFFGITLGLIVLLLATYKKTYKHVFEAKGQLTTVNDKLLNIDNSYNEVYILKDEINSLDNIIGGQSENPEQVQQMILNFVSNSIYEVNISSIEDTHVYSDNEFIVYTNSIEIEGSYFDLMKLFYDVEKSFNASKIISAKLFSVKNYRNNSKQLYLKLIFQNYEKSK
jgi:nicotinic acid phosphoribosyltransferase